MIKVNLLTNKARDTQANPAAAGIRLGGAPDVETTPEAQREAIVKLLLLVLFAGLLYAYERYNIGALTDEVRSVTAVRDQKATEKTQLQEQNARYLKHQQTIKELDEKLKILSDIAKKRLLVLKALERLQNIIPPRVWLSSFRYGGGGLGEQSIEMVGSSIGQEDFDVFLDHLDKSQDFKQVVPTDTKQVPSNTGSYISWRITAQLGDAEVKSK